MRDVLVVVVFVGVYMFFFLPSSLQNVEKTKELSGVIYDASSDTSTEEFAEIEVKEIPIIVLQDSTKEKKTEPMPLKKIEKIIKTAKTKQKEKVLEKVAQAVEQTKTGQPREPSIQEPLTYQSIRQIVTQSDKNYFYKLQTESNDIILALISFTPYENKGILKIKIDNNSKSYFFIGGVSVSSISTQFFGEQFVKSQGSIVAYLLLNNVNVRSGLTLTVLESGESAKSLRLNFSLP